MQSTRVDIARNRWFDTLCRQLLSLAPDYVEMLRRYTPVVGRPDLGAACVLAWALERAHSGISSAKIADHLISSGAFEAGDHDDVTSMVRAARIRWITKGLPIANWWDIKQLQTTLLEYLAPRIAAEQGAASARQQLITVFDLHSSELIGLLIGSPIRLAALPGDTSGSKIPADTLVLIEALVKQFNIGDYISTARSESLMGNEALARIDGWSREFSGDLEEYLREGQAEVLRWSTLHKLMGSGGDDFGHTEDALREFMETLEPESLAILLEVIERSSNQCREWIRGLTVSELALILPEDERTRRRRKWLKDYMSITRATFLMPDSIPDTVEPSSTPPTPTWVSSYVFDRGARFVHQSAGPISMWWGVVETESEQQDLLASLDTQIGMTIETDKDRIVIYFVMGPDDPIHGPPLAPFSFWPDNPHSALELILASLAGVRIDWYRLYEGRDLTHLRTIAVELPSDALTEAIDRADAALERAEMQDPHKSRRQILADHFLSSSNEIMFTGVDNAKSEEILVDLYLTDPTNPEQKTEFAAVAAARTALAEAELARVTAMADGSGDEATQTRVDEARRQYHMLRSRFHYSIDREFEELTSKAVSNTRAFVQFVEEEEYLAAVIAFLDHGKRRAEFVDLSHVQTNTTRAISDFWLNQTADSASRRQAADTLDEILLWVGSEVMAPIADVVRGIGVDHLVLCPSRTIEPFPLHAALVDAGRVLSDEFAISYTPSAAVLHRLLSRPGAGLRLDLVVAASGSHAPPWLNLRVLDGPDQEAHILQMLAPNVHVLSGADADPDAVIAAVSNARVAHMAAHGWALADALASGLCLAGATLGRALLSSARIHAGPSLHETSLVVLSACETARHPTGGRAVQAWRGLDSAFLARGARAVIASMWGVNDLAALIYGTVLHHGLASGASIAMSHTTALSVLRGSQVPGSRVSALLDTARPSWESELNDLELDRSYWWSAYRLSGVCW